MIVKIHSNAKAFLDDSGGELEKCESRNSLILGISDQLIQYPQRYPTEPLLATVHNQDQFLLAAVMTPPYNLILASNQVVHAQAMGLLIERLIDQEWQVPGVIASKDVATQFAKTWSSIANQPHAVKRTSILYELQDPKLATLVPGRLRLATLDDLTIVADWWHEFAIDINQPKSREVAHNSAQDRIEHRDIYLWVHEKPVSMAMKVRPTRSGISISLVYTPLQCRNHGYAKACVYELSRQLISQGWRYCTLYADASNTPANRVYKHIGYTPIDLVYEISFTHQT